MPSSSAGSEDELGQLLEVIHRKSVRLRRELGENGNGKVRIIAAVLNENRDDQSYNASLLFSL